MLGVYSVGIFLVELLSKAGTEIMSVMGEGTKESESLPQCVGCGVGGCSSAGYRVSLEAPLLCTVCEAQTSE